jgi:hypothetical protein
VGSAFRENVAGIIALTMVAGVVWGLLKAHFGDMNREQLLALVTASRLRNVLVFVVPVAGLVFACSEYQHYSQQKENREKAERQPKAAEVEQTISQFAERYNALTHWRNELAPKTMMDPIYSAELARLFVRSDGRPVLFIASLRDISTEGDSYVVLFDGRVNMRSRFQLRLECPESQARPLMSHPPGQNDRFAVVAHIASVNSGEEQSRDEGGSTYVSVATGSCVDLMPLGSYIGDYLEIFSRVGVR